MMSATDAGRLIAPAKSKKELIYRKGKTNDIIRVTLETEEESRADTKALAPHFSPDYDGMNDLWRFVKKNIRYKEDPIGVQWVQTPAHLWKKRIGDCKSMTVFICSVLHNMGLNYIIRFTSYNVFSRRVTHVYPIAILPNGRQVIMDAVYYQFNAEKKPFYYHKDVRRMTKIYKLSGIGSQLTAGLEAQMKALEDFLSDIPDSIINEGEGDVTNMTKGDLERIGISETWEMLADKQADDNYREQIYDAAKVLKSGSIAGIGSILDPAIQKDVVRTLRVTAAKKAPAFLMPHLPTPQNASAEIKGILSPFKKIFKKLWKKLMNWVWKGPAKKMGPYFLFQFIKKRTTKEGSRRKSEQLKTLNWLQKVGKFDKQLLDRHLFNGILKETGKTPAELINDAAGEKIGAASAWVKFAEFAIKAIKIILQVVKKVAGMFKKKPSEAGRIDETNASDLRVLQAPTNESKEEKSSADGLALAAAAAGVFFLLG